MKKTIPIVLVVIAVLTILIYSQLTIFIIQPIGALPEGKTLIITRLNKTQFIDSADAICEREFGGVNLICRIGAISGVLNNSKVFLRLPYSSWLYKVSTGGKTYDR